MTEQQAQQGAVFTLEKIYLKDVSFEAPSTPAAFMRKESPEISVELGIAHAPVDPENGFYEVMLAVKVTATHKESTAFLVELQQAGVFRIAGIPDEVRERTLEIACPHVLLPFAREAASELISKGGFPPLLIAPVNFEALYEQKLAAARQPAAGNA